MTAEFNWWLLLLGLVVGGGLTWLVLADTRRREQDLEDDELPDEAAWIEARMADEGDALPAETIQRVVQLHRAYLAIAPSDEGTDENWPPEESEAVPADPWQPAAPRPPAEHPANVPSAPSAPDEPGVRHQLRGG